MIIDEKVVAELKKWYYRSDAKDFAPIDKPPEINELIDTLEVLWAITRAAQTARNAGYTDVRSLNTALDSLTQP